MIEPGHPRLSIRAQCILLALPRSSYYYRPAERSQEDLALMAQIDRLFTDDPTLGVLGMQDELLDHGWKVGVKRLRNRMRFMGLEPIYPKRNLSKLGKAQYVRPYLLRGLKVTHPNHVWEIDITYIAMAKGFMYLTAVIDVYSRYIVGWKLSNTLAKEVQTDLLEELFLIHGKPEIINSDQGSQYTCEHWISFLAANGVKVSMDGKGRATDNAHIERWFRTLKQRHVYLYPASDGLELFRGINTFVHRYNRKRHQGIGRIKPFSLYQQMA